MRLIIRANDFEGASKMLKIAYKVCKQDFFLCYYSHYFLQYARLVFVRKYCNLYSVINVSRLSKLLCLDHLTNDEIQNWIVNAVRELQSWPVNKKDQKIDARLDVINNILYVQPTGINPLSNLFFLCLIFIYLLFFCFLLLLLLLLDSK